MNSLRTFAVSIRPSFFSGIFASLAVVMGTFMDCIRHLAKLAFDASETGILPVWIGKWFSEFSGKVALLWALRIFFGALAVASNIMMIKFYIASMAVNGATKATIYNFAFNFFITVLFTQC